MDQIRGVTNYTRMYTPHWRVVMQLFIAIAQQINARAGRSLVSLLRGHGQSAGVHPATLALWQEFSLGETKLPLFTCLRRDWLMQRFKVDPWSYNLGETAFRKLGLATRLVTDFLSPGCPTAAYHWSFFISNTGKSKHPCSNLVPKFPP